MSVHAKRMLSQVSDLPTAVLQTPPPRCTTHLHVLKERLPNDGEDSNSINGTLDPEYMNHQKMLKHLLSTETEKLQCHLIFASHDMFLLTKTAPSQMNGSKAFIIVSCILLVKAYHDQVYHSKLQC